MVKWTYSIEIDEPLPILKKIAIEKLKKAIKYVRRLK